LAPEDRECAEGRSLLNKGSAVGRILSEYVKHQLHSTMDRVGNNERRSTFNEHAIKMLAKKIDDLHDAVELQNDRITNLISRLKERFEQIDAALHSGGNPKTDAPQHDADDAPQS